MALLPAVIVVILPDRAKLALPATTCSPETWAPAAPASASVPPAAARICAGETRAGVFKRARDRETECAMAAILLRMRTATAASIQESGREVHAVGSLAHERSAQERVAVGFLQREAPVDADVHVVLVLELEADAGSREGVVGFEGLGAALV